MFVQFSLKMLRCKARVLPACIVRLTPLVAILSLRKMRMRLYLALDGSACSVYLERHKKLQRRACIDSRMLSTAVASPYQTLCELLAGDHE